MEWLYDHFMFFVKHRFVHYTHLSNLGFLYVRHFGFFTNESLIFSLVNPIPNPIPLRDRITFSKITKSNNIEINKEPEKWYEAFKIIYNDDFSEYTDCISLKLDMDILYEYQLDMKTIADEISYNYQDTDNLPYSAAGTSQSSQCT